MIRSLAVSPYPQRPQKMLEDLSRSFTQYNYIGLNSFKFSLKPQSEDFSKALRLKLLEEVNEVLLAEKKHELQEEIADVLTVIEELVKLHKIPMDVMLEIKNSKKEQRGGFEKRYFVSDVEFLEGSFGDLYCKKQPDKYEKIN